MRTTLLKSLVLLAIFTQLNAPSNAQGDTKEQLTIPLSDPGKPGSLQLKLIYGSIHITGYAGNQIVIDATARPEEKSEKPEKPKDESASGMKRIMPRNAGLDITATEENNVVKVNSRFTNNSIDLHIKVPLKFSLKIGTINNGNISVENVDGEMEISNVNGDVKLTNVSGHAVANTVNGLIKATFRTVDTKSPMAFSTLNGNVDVTLPPAARFDVKIKSDRGEIYSDFDVDVDKTQPQGTRSAKDGMYKVSVEDWVKGKVNGGGSEIMMKNMNGNIYVRKSK